VSDSISQLDQRTRDISDRVAGTEHRIRDEGKRLDQAVAQLQSTLDTEVLRLTAEGRRAATSGVRKSICGGILVLVGVALQTFG